jgi:hypothetical protein
MRRDDTSDMIMSEIIMRMAHDSDHSMDHKRSTQGSPLGLPWERSGRSTAADLPDLSGRRRTDSPMITHSPMHTHSPHPAPADAYRVSTHRTLAEGDMRNNDIHVLNIGKSTALHCIPCCMKVGCSIYVEYYQSISSLVSPSIDASSLCTSSFNFQQMSGEHLSYTTSPTLLSYTTLLHYLSYTTLLHYSPTLPLLDYR